MGIAVFKLNRIAVFFCYVMFFRLRVSLISRVNQLLFKTL